MYKFLILGAGPAGLSFANKLRDLGETDFLVIEKESEAGGLCRSLEIDGSPFDIGGGHFLDVRRPEVNEFLFKFMPENEWDKYDRDSRIDLNGYMVSHPIEANIWQMPLKEQVTYLKSIAVAGCNLETEMPIDFVDWIYWKLGKRIADDYMIPYNSKMFGENLSILGTYWLDKLPDVSFEETLLSCLSRKAYGKQPGHAQFYYPKRYGYGEVWLRMSDKIKKHMIFNVSVEGIDFNKRLVIDNNGNKYEAEKIITTIPWIAFKKIEGMPEELAKLIKELKHSSIQIDYYSENLNTEAQWIYYPSLKIPFHRILVRHSFCPQSRGYWTETNIDRAHLNKKQSLFSYINEYAYPLNTLKKPAIMKELLKFAEEKNVYGLGRWGEHEHYNSDMTVKRAMDLLEKLNIGSVRL